MLIVPLPTFSTILSAPTFEGRPGTIAFAHGVLGAKFILEDSAFAQGAPTLLLRFAELVLLERVGARTEVEFVRAAVAFEAICGVRGGGA
jgi:hypothetical protein